MKTKNDTVEYVIKEVETIKIDSVKTLSVTKTYRLEENNVDYKTVIQYIDSLIWPIITIVILMIFFKPIKKLVDRIATESDEISSTVLGISAKFRQKINIIKDSKESSETIKKNLEDTINESILDDFRILSSHFFTKSYNIRQKVAKEIAILANDMSIEQLYNFASSTLPGERVASFIGIKTHLGLFPNLEKDEKLIETISAGLDDKYSRVRYRVVETISTSNYLIEIFKVPLILLEAEEPNSAVKEIIKDVFTKVEPK